MTSAYFIGIDVGTSGVRAVIIDTKGNVVKTAKSLMSAHGDNRRDPMVWWAATDDVLKRLNIDVDIKAVCIDATSGTVLPIERDGTPIADALMYNDSIDDNAIIGRISEVAPATSAVHGSSSALARAVSLQVGGRPYRIIHQADWIAGMLCGQFDISDESNSLKTGYDPVARCWPAWLAEAGLEPQLLPQVIPAGTPHRQIQSSVAKKYKLATDAVLVAGVTDGCASFLATGAAETGDCVTALGSTITMKMLCDQPLFEPNYGVYSHRIGDRWLAGGASNSGGNVLAHFFSDEKIVQLSSAIDPTAAVSHDYYPLLSPGERFPHNDAQWQGCITPRPEADEDFLHCLLAGMADIEALGYQRLRELGAPAIRSMRTVGGGAANDVWSEIRKQTLSARFAPSLSTEAAVGAALLARDAISTSAC